MNDPSLRDQLQLAQIDKTRAEARKLDKEAEAVVRQVRSDFWSEVVKIVGAIVLGIGGAVAAYTQHELAELKAKVAEDKQKEAESAMAAAEQARKTAFAATAEAEATRRAAEARRDAAIREQREAEANAAQLRASLKQTDTALKQATPGGQTRRLVFVQFQGELTRELINELRISLGGKGFDAPGAERKSGDYQNLVKYFTPSDRRNAEELAVAVEGFFASKGCPVKMRIVPVNVESQRNSPLEVWLAMKCRPR